jgi:protein-disulfide isomerase
MTRIVLMLSAVLGIAALGGGTAAIAAPIEVAEASPPPVGPSDIVLGKPDAPVTIIEYASMTCPHCADFETKTMPEVKKNWIDTGKARLVFRDFPLDGLAVKAAQLAHCSGPEKFYPFLDVLYGQQGSWARDRDPVGALGRLAKLGGVSEEQFKACLADDKLQVKIIGSRQTASEAGVESTPTFFINGKKSAGFMTYDEFSKLLSTAASAS